MKIINPVTVLCTESEFISAEHHQTINAHPFQFVLKADGRILKRFRAATGKWLAITVDKIPNIVCPFVELGVEKGSLIPAEVLRESHDFLPAGKIPMHLLRQIVAFFKSVMQYKMKDVVRGSNFSTQSSFSHNYEAMALICWSPDTGYSIRIPTQRVSAASVSYDHDCYDLAAGDVIVVDVHSHNAMSAFYSGTDERDDRSSICYSGVVGKLDTDTPQIIFRFNAQEKKIPVQISDIFGDPEVAVPQEWLDKVSVGVPVYSGSNWYKGKYNPRSPANGLPEDDDHLDWRGYLGVDDDDVPARSLPNRNQAALNRKERRQLAKVNNFAKLPNFSGLPNFSNPALKVLKAFEFDTDYEPGSDLDEEILAACPEFFNHVVLNTSVFPSLCTVAIYALIGGLSEDFYINNPISNGTKIVKAYADSAGSDKEYNFTSVYKEFVMRPYFNRRLKGVLVSENELNAAVTATVEDAWSVFLLIQLT